MTLIEIDKLTFSFAGAHSLLVDEARQIDAEVRAVYERHRREYDRLVLHCATRKDHLETAIKESPGLFSKPRTQILHGVKVGFRKQVGGLAWDDAERVVTLIEKHYGEDSSMLRIKKTPNKEALITLPAGELKRLGVEVLADSDAVVVSPVEGDAEKLVAAVLAALGKGEEKR